jgi:hypothetical protein
LFHRLLGVEDEVLRQFEIAGQRGGIDFATLPKTGRRAAART